MEQVLQQRCDTFAHNKEEIRKGFRLEYPLTHCLCALLFGDKQAHVEKMKECKRIIKAEEGLFSSFRGYAFLAMAAMLAQEDDPAARFAEVKRTYTALKKKKFWGTDFLALAAFLVRESDEQKTDELVDRAREAYRLMKDEHPFLTSSEDYGYAVMLAMSGMRPADAVAEAERCYEALRGDFFSKNAVQGLSLVLALGDGRATDKAQRAVSIFRKLKNGGQKFGTSYELPCLGVLAILPGDEDAIVQDVLDAYKCIHNHKGFGGLKLNRRERLMFASAVVAQERAGEESALSTTVANAVTNTIIAIQIALIAAITASASAAAASSSGGGNG